jgi:hypothetical protein
LPKVWVWEDSGEALVVGCRLIAIVVVGVREDETLDVSMFDVSERCSMSVAHQHSKVKLGRVLGLCTVDNQSVSGRYCREQQH